VVRDVGIGSILGVLRRRIWLDLSGAAVAGARRLAQAGPLDPVALSVSLAANYAHTNVPASRRTAGPGVLDEA